MEGDVNSRLERLEARIRRLEEAQFGTARAEPVVGAGRAEPAADSVPMRASAERAQQQLEFEVGQVWFSRIGITVLALGAAFAISLPYTGLSSWIPALAGMFFAGVVVAAAHLWRGRLGLLAGFVRGGGCILLYFSALRLFLFGQGESIPVDSPIGIAVLLSVPVAGMVLSLVYSSTWLAVIAMASGCFSAIMIPLPWLSMAILSVAAGAAAWLNAKKGWRGVLFFGIGLCFSAFFVIMLNRFVTGNPFQWNVEPRSASMIAGGLSFILAAGSLFRRVVVDGREAPITILTSLLNCGMGFIAFFATTEVAAETRSGVPYLIAAVFYLAVATAFWARERSRWSTFAYAMTGYFALSVAIQAFSQMPDVFVWLSLQSLLVVATAVWFQSRFIVTANFIIYIATIIGYLAVAEAGSGISFVFGAVALGSARILSWQKDRLRLQTELMRNGYLLCSFLAFPYAAYHLVPSEYVSISWVLIAVFYYLMNLVVSSPKYRWMGHGTLIGTVLYLVVVGIIQLKPAYRILSFIVLGVVLVGVSLVFSIIRKRSAAGMGEAEKAEGPVGSGKE